MPPSSPKTPTNKIALRNCFVSFVYFIVCKADYYYIMETLKLPVRLHKSRIEIPQYNSKSAISCYSAFPCTVTQGLEGATFELGT